jgi:hypothetical protein
MSGLSVDWRFTLSGKGAMPLSIETGSPGDFDFMVGHWQVKHRRLKSRLTNCTEWLEFSGQSSTTKVLGGFGNVEDNILSFPDGAVRACALRSFDESAGTWAIWWLDRRLPHELAVPVVGAFQGPTGTFFAHDSLNGQPIRVRFIWKANPGMNPIWEQAFSPDEGRFWETNWTMEFSRA